ncbi:MAG: hypothetical protein CM15mP84_00330 [Cellvibrionales bacterium]|nr:MAG: hypothetical protein CM15mP84_00330 [Cellvibrionales bacterium]
MAYRFRPIGEDVDSCLFEILMLEPLPEGATHPDPLNLCAFSVEQSYTEVDELAWLGAVYDQDTGNLQLSSRASKQRARALRWGIIRRRGSDAFT